MRRTYKFLLLLYPRGHRDRFAEEMTGVFEEALAESRAEGWAWYVRFSFSEMAGLVAGATEAWLAQKPAPKPAPQAPSASSSYLPQEVRQAQQRVDANVAAMVHAIANHQFERARALSNQEREAREKFANPARQIQRRIWNALLAPGRGLGRKRPQQLFSVQRSGWRVFVFEENINVAA